MGALAVLSFLSFGGCYELLGFGLRWWFACCWWFCGGWFWVACWVLSFLGRLVWWVCVVGFMVCCLYGFAVCGFAYDVPRFWVA